LLYLVTKNHVFIDGNKRIAATLFIYFLNYYNILNIDNKTLVALTLLIAESNPKEKNIIIDLIINFLNN
jgi:prophage maintenance system killer protein